MRADLYALPGVSSVYFESLPPLYVGHALRNTRRTEYSRSVELLRTAVACAGKYLPSTGVNISNKAFHVYVRLGVGNLGSVELD